MNGSSTPVPTPADLTNAYPASPLRYRAGTTSSFLASMLAAAGARARARAAAAGADLGRSLAALIDVPPRVDDPRHALFDAWASALDVLTFYTERIANEHYFATATELGSLIALARQVSEYRNHGAAAATPLAFTFDASSETVHVPAGTQVMSVPAPGEAPQVFETDEDLDGVPDWNALAPVTTRRPEVDPRAASLDFAGAPRIAPGDVLLVCSAPDDVAAGAPAWALRTVEAVTPQPAVATARADLVPPALVPTPLVPTPLVPPPGPIEGSGALPGDRPQEAGVFAFRQRATLFGANAPIAREKGDPLWPSFRMPLPGGPTTLDLDAVYPEVLPGSWLVLDAEGARDLFAVLEVTTAFRDDTAVIGSTVTSRSGSTTVASPVTISGRVTRVRLDRIPGVIAALHLDGTTEPGSGDGPRLERFWRSATVFAQSEALALAPTAVQEPVAGAGIDLAAPTPAFPGDRPVVVTGRAPAARVPNHVTDLRLHGPIEVPVPPGTVLTILPPYPEATSPDGPPPVWTVTFARHTGTVTTDQLVFVDAPADSPPQAEAATALKGGGDPQTTLVLDAPLQRRYDRASCRVLANVVGATHGESAGQVDPTDGVRREILGSGDATPCQSFRLSKPRLTYTVAGTTPQGTSLRVEVNGVAWTEMPNLSHSGGNDPHFFVRADDAGVSTLIFGDGITGARLPSGHENVKAIYRSGIGLAGRLQAGQLTQLLGRPLGVKAVTNPLPTTGFVDPEPAASFRVSARGALRSLSRAVSVADYQAMAQGQGGVGKALAVQVHVNGRSVIHLTLAGEGGQPIATVADPGAVLDTLRRNGDPHQILAWGEAEVVTFEAALRIYVQPPGTPAGSAGGAGRLGPIPAAVLDATAAAAAAAVEGRFGFGGQGLAQAVLASDLIATVQGLAGVAGVALDAFSLNGAADSAPPAPGLPPTVLRAASTRVRGGTVLPAQLVLIAPAGPRITPVAAT